MTTYSGSVANFCAYAAVLKPADQVLSLAPSIDAHQSHGGKQNVSSKNGALLMVDIAHFTGLIAAGVSPNPVPYADLVTASTTKTMCGPHSGFIMCKKQYAKQVEQSIYPGNVASCHLQTIAAMAYTLAHSQTETFRNLMRQVVRNAKYLCKALEERGFKVFTGGTDCHMFLLDVTPFSLDGKRFAEVLNQVHINVNSKQLPFEKTELPGGIRVGTTVLTQRGMKEQQMEEIAEIFYILAKEKYSVSSMQEVRERVLRLSKTFPI